MGPKTAKRIDELKRAKLKAEQSNEHLTALRIQQRIERLFQGKTEEEVYGGDRNRPYNGPLWHASGEAGRLEIPKMTIRDLGDIVFKVLKEEYNLDSDENMSALTQKIINALPKKK